MFSILPLNQKLQGKWVVYVEGGRWVDDDGNEFWFVFNPTQGETGQFATNCLRVTGGIYSISDAGHNRSIVAFSDGYNSQVCTFNWRSDTSVMVVFDDGNAFEFRKSF